MDWPMNMADEQSVPAGISRREMLAGTAGGMLAAGLFAGGCASGNRKPWVSEYTPLPSPAVCESGPVPANPAPSPMSTSALTILPRSGWTTCGVARPRGTTNGVNDMNGIRQITVHHDAIRSTDLKSMSQVTRRIESIRATHVRDGWADIGYHFIIDPQGRVWEGRSVAWQGAHVKDQNEHNVGVMLLGNFDQQSVTPDATRSLDRTVAMLMSRYRVSLKNVRTHKELAPTACPGRSLQAYVSKSRSRGGALAMSAGQMGLA